MQRILTRIFPLPSVACNLKYRRAGGNTPNSSDGSSAIRLQILSRVSERSIHDLRDNYSINNNEITLSRGVEVREDIIFLPLARSFPRSYTHYSCTSRDRAGLQGSILVITGCSIFPPFLSPLLPSLLPSAVSKLTRYRCGNTGCATPSRLPVYLRNSAYRAYQRVAPYRGDRIWNLEIGASPDHGFRRGCGRTTSRTGDWRATRRSSLLTRAFARNRVGRFANAILAEGHRLMIDRRRPECTP